MQQGNLFTRDYLELGIVDTAAWSDFGTDDVARLHDCLISIFKAFPHRRNPNEAQTEDDLIWKVLAALGWIDVLRNQPLSAKGRDHVPDGLLYADAKAKARANKRSQNYKRYGDGLAIVESKRWNRPLDRRAKGKDEIEVPSSQMLRYLRRLDDLTDGKVRWGILTNGRYWRLYYQGAKSVSEDFLELDLPAILGVPPYGDDLLAPRSKEQSEHWLKVFALMFRRDAFLSSETDSRTFHQISLDEGRFYEERIAKDLSNIVFEKVFPDLARALIERDDERPATADNVYLDEIKHAALVLLYRLLFILFAEDRRLLPVDDDRYDDYGLRQRVRLDVAKRMDASDTFSNTRSNYWHHTKQLFGSIAEGDKSIGLPPYNGGLFDDSATPVLQRIDLPDSDFARSIDDIGRVDDPERGRRYVNYRDLSVQQLGSIYERLLEYDLVAIDGKIDIRLNIFARKGSGSYYTPDELVRLIIEHTVGPLVDERLAAFADKAQALKSKRGRKDERLQELEHLDPASAILELKVCDPAMGSGHFLVDIVDYLADRIIDATEAAREAVDWETYVSPLQARIEDIRKRILAQAKKGGWSVSVEQLDDRMIIRRMILKRVIYGVDKNPMAVELAKVALWLHTFTVGAPLSFLDHHLRCGDSLFGESVRHVMDYLAEHGGLLSRASVQTAKGAASAMLKIEAITDADIAEVKESAARFETIEEATSPLAHLMDFTHAVKWLAPDDQVGNRALDRFIKGEFGDPIDLATGTLKLPELSETHKAAMANGRNNGSKLDKRAAKDAQSLQRLHEIWNEAWRLVAEERFLHWEVAFPGVWTDWESAEHKGGFDAVVSNPPWDRIKFQEVEWFAARKLEIALATTAARRAELVAKLKRSNDLLAGEYDRAVARADTMSRMARDSGAFPLLSGGDTNIYSLFVELALSLIRPDGMVGVLTPSGIASDKTASTFFSQIATGKRLAALFDFENRRPPKQPFFPDVDSRFKFCTFIAAGARRSWPQANCGFFLRNTADTADPNRSFTLKAEDFALVNPNTGTAPIFRTRRDAEITTAIYRRFPVLVDRSVDPPRAVWPVKYATMFHMTNDSHLFRSRQDLEQMGAYPVEGNRWKKGDELFVPLYEGKMVQAYDHRAANIVINPRNVKRPAQPESTSRVCT